MQLYAFQASIGRASMPAKEVDGGYPSEPLAPYIYIRDADNEDSNSMSGILLGAKGNWRQ
jgi:hypothetical protein